VEGLTTLPDATAVNWQFVVELFALPSFYYQRAHAGIALNFYCHLGSWGLSPLTPDKLRPLCLTDNEGNKFSDYVSRARMLVRF